jgi:hypothetical protein
MTSTSLSLGVMGAIPLADWMASHHPHGEPADNKDITRTPSNSGRRLPRDRTSRGEASTPKPGSGPDSMSVSKLNPVEPPGT